MILNYFTNIFIENQLDDNIIEHASNESAKTLVHHLPHHTVICLDKVSSVLRVVFDASSKSGNRDSSLSDCLYTRHQMISNILPIAQPRE